jgi:cysteine desulfurase/selenocysteine lyase
MSNVLGTITPVREIVEVAHAVGALVLVDGAQGVPHLPTDVQELGLDFLVFSFHKMLGPTGVGILWARPEILEAMPPFLSGGDMISAVWRDRARWNELPWKFEAGTPNIGDVIACGMAIDYLQGIGMENVRAHEIELTDYALKGLKSLADDVIIYGPLDARERGGVISFNFKDVHPHDVGQILNEAGIAIRAGHHCCQPLMRDLNVAGTARASFYLYNTKEEVDALLEALKEADKVMGHVACR